MSARQPKVSVFLPTYNHVHYIDQAIQSVLAQDYENLEIVVGDDGSTDGTEEVISRYGRTFPGKFKLLLSRINRGITANCNDILGFCDGEYVALFAGDDVWLPGKISQQVELMESRPESSVCITRVEWFDGATGETLRIYPEGNFDTKGLSRIEAAYYLGSTGTSMLVRRSMMPSYGFDPSIPMVSDWLFYIELLRSGTPVFIDETLARYRRHQASMSGRTDLIFREHLRTLLLIDERYPELRAEVANFLNKYVLLNAVEIFSSLADPRARLAHLDAILSREPAGSVVRATFRRLSKRVARAVSLR